MINRKQRGAEGEELAVSHLKRLGLAIRARNYRFHRGEIDIVAQDGDTLVFVEVKARRSRAFGDPEEAVTPRKAGQIRRIAQGYLLEQRAGERECRFDVIAVGYEEGKPVLRHIKNAF